MKALLISAKAAPFRSGLRPSLQDAASTTNKISHYLSFFYHSVSTFCGATFIHEIRIVYYKSYKGEVGKIAPNIFERNFKTNHPLKKWATDVTQINMNGEKVYLSLIIDMYNCEVISYSILKSPNFNMIKEMLSRAFAKVKDTRGIIIHSDQGWQHQHLFYRKLLLDHGIIQGMSRKGNCLDNAMAENFFGIMKSEWLYPNKFHIAKFISALKIFIEYYNNRIIKLRLNELSPVKYRVRYALNYKYCLKF